MEAIILAGGLGTRLRGVVSDVPKCMAPVCGRPFLSYLLEYLEKYGVDRVILALGYMHEIVEQWVEHSGLNLEFVYSMETEPLGTGGAICKALEYAKGDEVLILNGDTFFDVDIDAFFRLHRLHGAILSMALKPMRNFERYGTVEINESGGVEAFREKKFCERGVINGGVYVIQKDNSIFDGLPARFSFEKEILEKLAGNGRLFGFVNEGYFIDIGIPEDYARAGRDFEQLFDDGANR